MASTTNYNWDTPDNSGLVKNGAQDIRTLGSAIDTSLWNIGFGQAGKNRIINGDFNIWQRGTSFAISANAAYTCDRFLSDSGAMNYTFSRQSFTAGTAPVAGYESAFFFRALATSGSGGFPKIQQKIEDVRTFAGNTVTLSFWAKASSAITVSPDIIQDFGSGGSGSVFIGVVATSITTSWARYSITYTVPSISGKTIGTGSSLIVSLNIPNSGTASFDIWGLQLEYGSKATPFETASGSIQGELALCQRYYFRMGGLTGFTMLGQGVASATTRANVQTMLPVTMRVVPTSLDYSTLCLQQYDGQPLNAATAVILTALTGVNLLGIQVDVASGLTTGSVFRFMTNSSTSGFLGISAEL